jgi:soluble lytic murein transglycosylase
MAAPAQPTDSEDRPLRTLKKALEEYGERQYESCAKRIRRSELTKLHNPDTVLFLQGQCWFYARRFRQARKAFGSLVKRHPESIHFTLASFRKADCAWELGQRARAFREYEEASVLAPDPRTDPAVGLSRQMEHLANTNKPSAANRIWNRLRTHYPLHPLVQHEPSFARDARPSFDESLQMAHLLHQARQWDQALSLLDGIPDPADRAQKYELAFRRGTVLFDKRDRYEDSLRALLAARKLASGAGEAEQAWFLASRALGRLDRDAEAIASHLAMVKRYPRGKHAARALYYAGWLEQNLGHCDQAQLHFERVLKEYPKNKWAREARWFLAWCHIRNDRWSKVIEILAPQLGLSREKTGGRALYWTGVAWFTKGESKRARLLWNRVLSRFPLSWYALLARQRLGDQAPDLSPAPRAAKIPAIEDPVLTKADELCRAGLKNMASLFLRQQESDFLTRHASDKGLANLLGAFRKADNFHRPWLLTLRKRYGSLRRIPTKRSRVFWDHAYARCRRDLLRQFAGSGPFVHLLQSIMRTESGFDEFAQSVANARGLMQMIPPTAERVASQLHLDYSDEKLFEPEFNIRTAVWYIGKLREKFKSQWPLVAAAYNAGAPAMMSWCEENGHLPLDQFVEAIPWTEPRRYAKRVMGAFYRYTYLEALPPPAIVFDVDAEYLDNDIDY